MIVPPNERAWDAWSPMQLAQKLNGVDAHWYVVGGWALDLWLSIVAGFCTTMMFGNSGALILALGDSALI